MGEDGVEVEEGAVPGLGKKDVVIQVGLGRIQ